MPAIEAIIFSVVGLVAVACFLLDACLRARDKNRRL